MESGGLDGAMIDPLLEGWMERIEAGLAYMPPPLAGAGVYAELRREAAAEDIFGAVKARFTEALDLASAGIGRMLDGSGDPLLGSLGASAWGNLIDVAQGRAVPGLEDLLPVLSRPPDPDDRRLFAARLRPGTRLLVLGDNAGETVLDRLLIERLPGGVGVMYAVRNLPVMNDAVRSDAVMAGIPPDMILDSPIDAPTFTWEAVQSLCERGGGFDTILAKGQGNLEGLLGTGDDRLFHSFVVKCDVVSELVGRPRGTAVFAHAPGLDQGR
jgi:hypothetical protein